jgi:hypothetical protein
MGVAWRQLLAPLAAQQLPYHASHLHKQSHVAPSFNMQP